MTVQNPALLPTYYIATVTAPICLKLCWSKMQQSLMDRVTEGKALFEH